jgi:hypothetical protein
MLLALALAIPLIVAGQSNPPATRTRLLSLDESIEMALSRNLDLQIQRALSPRERVGVRGKWTFRVPSVFESLRAARTSPGNIFRFAPCCNSKAVVEIWSRYMKALLYAQFNPTKTLGQLIDDRNLYRILAVLTLILVWCG